jgi:lipoprotein-releasing system permease protein
VKGVSARDEVRVNRLGEYVKKGSLELSGGGIVLGSELAGRLGVKVGDRVWLAAPGSGMLKGAGMPSGFRIDGKDFRVAGVFTSGMYEYDANLAYIDIADARELFAEGGPQGGAAVRVDNALKVDEAARALRAALGPQYAVRTWMDLNRSLIAALKLEKTVMFIILALIVAVACCNIASTLIMMVVEKTRDIGIFKTIGSTNMNVMAIFALQGGLIGAIGTAAGTAAGLAVCWWLKTYRLIGLPKEIYYIDKLPVKVDPYDVSLIITVSILLSLVLSIYPAYMASRLDPVEALRYE